MNKSLVLKEALSIPKCINKFINNDLNNYDQISKLIENKKIKFIVTLARGSSDCAALYGSYIFAKYLGLPTYSMPPSIITIEQSKFDFSEALVIIISQSGLSKDLIECAKISKQMDFDDVLFTVMKKRWRPSSPISFHCSAAPSSTFIKNFSSFLCQSCIKISEFS